MKIKVCGMRERVNVEEIARLGIDYMGFIFYPPSPRDCSGMVESVTDLVPPGVTGVMVSVNMPEEELLNLTDKYGFRVVQLHGDESPEECCRLRKRGLTVFKALGIKESESLEKTVRYEGCVDMFVFDTASSARGGTGRKFNWGLLEDYKGETPFLLSGGIGVEDAQEVLEINHPRFAGVDLNSKFEKKAAFKDTELLEKFIKEIRL